VEEGLVVAQALAREVEDGEGRAGLGRQRLAELVADGEHLASMERRARKRERGRERERERERG
jgi:hypothetical protein